jgi:hypothetical protein
MRQSVVQVDLRGGVELIAGGELRSMQAILVDESDVEMDTAFHGDPRVDMYCKCKGEIKSSSLIQRSFYKTKDVGCLVLTTLVYVYVYVEEDEQSPGIKRRYKERRFGGRD